MLIQPALGGHFQPGSLATLCPITKEGARTRKNKYAGRRWDMLGVLLQLVLECCLLLPQTLSWLCILSPWVSFSIPSHCCCLTGNDALAVCRKIKLVLGWGSHFQRFKDINVWLSNIYLQLSLCPRGRFEGWPNVPLQYNSLQQNTLSGHSFNILALSCSSPSLFLQGFTNINNVFLKTIAKVKIVLSDDHYSRYTSDMAAYAHQPTWIRHGRIHMAIPSAGPAASTQSRRWAEDTCTYKAGAPNPKKWNVLQLLHSWSWSIKKILYPCLDPSIFAFSTSFQTGSTLWLMIILHKS